MTATAGRWLRPVRQWFRSAWRKLDAGIGLSELAEWPPGCPPLARLERLEERALLSATPFATDFRVNAFAAGSHQAAFATHQAVRRELVIIDPRVPNYRQLVAGLVGNQPGRSVQVVVLDPARDGIGQVSQVLARYHGLDAVHIVSHGQPGEVQLGSTWLDSGDLSRYAPEIHGWSRALNRGADLLFYGCDVAETGQGRALLRRVGRLTGADVAGSTGLTGSAAEGGSWTLEYHTGPIHAAVPFTEATLQQWQGLLATFTVTNTNDSEAGSLRQAVLDANGTPGPNTIRFGIGSGVQTIKPTSPLPAITNPVTIDGTTQPGFDGPPLIVLDGSRAGSGTTGLLITAGSSTVRGLVIDNFKGTGLELNGGSGNVVQGNFIGTDATGTQAGGNGAASSWDPGLLILNSANNTVGGTAAAARNLLSGNSYDGLDIEGSLATGNVVEGNFMGTDAGGNAALANGLNGVWIGEGASNNTVGGTAAGAGNLLSGNLDEGIEIDGSGSSPSSGNVIQGNLIGTDAAGTAALGNGQFGVSLEDAANNQIGGTAAGAGNVISANASSGILIAGSASTGDVVQGNFIGTDRTGSLSLGNAGDGITISASGDGPTLGFPGNLSIGGTVPGAGNTIANNTGNGVVVTGGSGDAIQGNAVFANAGGGIDLGGPGITANTGTRNSALANDGMNYPVFTSVAENGTTLAVAGYVGSAPGQATFGGARIDLYKATNDPSGHGQGQTYLGFVTADASGNFNADLTVSGLNVGDRITATATDSSNNTSEYAGNASVSALPAGSTTVASSRDPSSLGQAVTFTATVKPGLLGLVAPTGTVTFLDGPTALGTVALSGGSASFTTSALSAGSHSITAHYSGDLLYSPSTSSPLTQTVQGAGPVINLDPDGTGSTYSATYSANTPGVAVEDVADATITDAASPTLASLTVTIQNPHDGSNEVLYADTTGTQIQASFSGGKLTLSGTDTLANYQQVLRTVTYQDQKASPDTSALRNVLFVANDGTSTSSTVTAHVTVSTAAPAASSTAVVSSPSPSVYGQTVTFTATVSAASPATGTPTGTVTFTDGTTDLGTVPLSGGTAAFTTSALAAGSHSIIATFSGDSGFQPSTSGALSQTVTPAPLTVTADDASRAYGQANPAFTASYSGLVNGDTVAVFGGAPSLSTAATMASPVGRYAIVAGPGTLSDPDYTFTFANGTLTVTPAGVNQPPVNTVPGTQSVPWNKDLTFSAATGNAVSVSDPDALPTDPIQVSLSTTFRWISLSTTAGLTFVSGANGLPSMTFQGTQASINAALDGMVLKHQGAFVGVGNLTITTNDLGNRGAGGPQSTTSVIPIDVDRASSRTALTSSLTTSVYGQAVSFTATVGSVPAGTGTPTGTVTFLDGTIALGTVALSGGTATLTTSSLPAGTHAITARYNGDSLFRPDTSGPLTQAVTPASLTVTANDTGKVYGQADPAFTASYSGFVNGDTAASLGGTLGFSTPATAASHVGGYAVAPGGLTSGNYAISFANGTLTVTAASATVTANDATKVYGSAVPALTASYRGLVNGDTAAVLGGAPALGTAATATSPVGTYAIAAGQGTLSDQDYTFAFVNGTLTVTPARLTVTANAASKVSGQANPAFTASYGGLVNGDTPGSLGGALAFATPATAGSPAGTYAVTPGGLTSTNYAIAFVSGTLTVTQGQPAGGGAPTRTGTGGPDGLGPVVTPLHSPVAVQATLQANGPAGVLAVGTAGTGTNRGPAPVGAGDRVPDRGSAASGAAPPLTTAADLKGPADARVVATTFGAAGSAEVPAQGSTREVFAMDVRNISSSVRVAGAPLESGGEAPPPAEPASGEAEPLLWGAREVPEDLRLAPGAVPGEGLAAGAVWAEAAEPFRLTSPVGLTREVSALAGTGLLASTGYVLLNTRAGVWLLSMLTAKPLWREFDPLEVLYAWEKEEKGAENGDGETLLGLVR